MSKLFIISGPTGAGKTSVVDELEKQRFSFTKIITTTTRTPRIGEKNGKDYHFVTEKKFKKLIKEKNFLEWANVYGNYYGSTHQAVEEALKKRKPVIITLDCQGAATFKKIMPESVVIFLTSPLNILLERLHRRNKDTKEVVKTRIKECAGECKICHRESRALFKNKNVYLVENKEGQLDETIKKVKKIIKRKIWKKKILKK